MHQTDGGLSSFISTILKRIMTNSNTKTDNSNNTQNGDYEGRNKGFANVFGSESWTASGTFLSADLGVGSFTMNSNAARMIFMEFV